MKIRNEQYVINDDKMIYKIVGFEELGSTELMMDVEMELVAGYDYVNPDESNQQGYVSKENFVDDVQGHSFTWFPMNETIEDRLKDDDFKIIDINKYTIHPVSWEEK